MIFNPKVAPHKVPVGSTYVRVIASTAKKDAAACC